MLSNFLVAKLTPYIDKIVGVISVDSEKRLDIMPWKSLSQYYTIWTQKINCRTAIICVLWQIICLT